MRTGSFIAPFFRRPFKRNNGMDGWTNIVFRLCNVVLEEWISWTMFALRFAACPKHKKRKVRSKLRERILRIILPDFRPELLSSVLGRKEVNIWSMQGRDEWPLVSGGRSRKIVIIMRHIAGKRNVGW